MNGTDRMRATAVAVAKETIAEQDRQALALDPSGRYNEAIGSARRATYSDPEFGEPDPDGMEDPAVRWNLDFGCNLSFGIDLEDASLVVNLSISDWPLLNGGLQKSVTRAQLRQYALYLLRLADDQEREAAARQDGTR